MTLVSEPAISEKDFQTEVLKRAKQFGWMAYHTFDSRRSQKGFPDLILVRGVVMICLELKSDSKSSKESDEQKAWIKALKGVKIITADFAYPRHLDQVVSALSARAR